MIHAPLDLSSLSSEQLQEVVRRMQAELVFKQATIDKMTHEQAIIKRLMFAAKSEATPSTSAPSSTTPVKPT